MEISIHPNLCDKVPGIFFGILQYDGIAVSDSPQMLKGRLQLFQESLFFDLEDKNVTDFEEIKEWRTLFKKLGKDPNRYRHSAEALYRRVKKQNYIPTMNSAADINNFFSLKFRLPIGIYDIAFVSGAVEIRHGRPDDAYHGLNGRENAMENIIVTADDKWPFGSPFVDSVRTAVTQETKDALQVVFFPPSFDAGEAEKLLESLGSMFVQVNGGEFSKKILACT